MPLGAPCPVFRALYAVFRMPCAVFRAIYIVKPGRGGGLTGVGWVVEIIIYKKRQGYTLATLVGGRAGGHQLDEAIERPGPAQATPDALVVYFLRVREHIWLH